MRYRLRTLLVVLALAPPLLAWLWWFAPIILYFLCIFAAAFTMFLLALWSAVVIGHVVAR